MASVKLINIDIEKIPRSADYILNELSPYARTKLAKELKFTDEMMEAFYGEGATEQASLLVEALKEWDKANGRSVESPPEEEKAIKEAADTIKKKSKKRGRPKKTAEDALEAIENAVLEEQKTQVAAPAPALEEQPAPSPGRVLPPPPAATNPSLNTLPSTTQNVAGLKQAVPSYNQAEVVEQMFSLISSMHETIAKEIKLLQLLEQFLTNSK
jgi:hypothetical protein